MSVGEDVIFEVTNLVWQSMLGREVSTAGSDTDLGEGPFMTGVVLITGAFEGGVSIDVQASTARHLAALMFGMEDVEDEVSDEETVDALGELANMVGGNLKALMAQPSKISLPSVTTGTGYRVSIPGTVSHTRVAMRCGGVPVHVSLHVSDGITAGATDRSVA